MKNKNTIIVICSVVLAIAAAAVTAFLIIRKFNARANRLESTDLVFENDFDDEPAEDDVRYAAAEAAAEDAE